MPEEPGQRRGPPYSVPRRIRTTRSLLESGARTAYTFCKPAKRTEVKQPGLLKPKRIAGCKVVDDLVKHKNEPRFDPPVLVQHPV